MPIKGWAGSSAVLSDISSGRDVVLNIFGGSSTQNIPDATLTKITNWGTPAVDTVNGWNSSSSEYTVPSTGYYNISAQFAYIGSGITDNQGYQLYLYKNGSAVLISEVRSGGTRAMPTFNVAALQLSKGDILSLYTYHDNTSNLSDSSDGNPPFHFFTIAKTASPQAILDTETVAARYTSNSGQAIAASFSNFIYEDKEFDTHNAYNTSTGVYTVPVSGYYQVNAFWSSIFTPSVDYTELMVSLFLNSINIEQITARTGTTAPVLYSSAKLISTFMFAKGDQIEIRAQCNDTPNAWTNGTANVFSIHRIK